MPGRCGVGKQKDTVNVIRHDYKRIQHHIFEMIWDLIPTGCRHLTR